MSTAPLRAAMVPVTRQMRAYFAPVNRTNEAPTIFDPGLSGVFELDAPPAPWLDLGWIENFERTYDTPADVVRSGAKASPAGQFRGPMDARVGCDFREWGKLQMALAGGSEHMNVLASDPNANPQPSGGTPIPAAAVLTGSTANEIIVGVGVIDGFAIGDMIAVDNDYAQQTGYVGTGISAAYVENPVDVNRDINYIRRVTFNIGRVAQKTTTSLVLAQALLGGTPPSGANVQKVVAFVDREGGAFFQEWSALFVAEDESGGRVCLHYPRLSPTTAIETQIGMTNPPPAGRAKVLLREKEVEIAKPIVSLALHAAFQAMPHVDENDGQTVVCYRSYFPAVMAAVY
jgi:hypothetical protein